VSRTFRKHQASHKRRAKTIPAGADCPALVRGITDEPLRGRTFALLRTLSRSSVPVANAGGGALLLVLATPAVIGFSAVLVGIPGVFGYGVRQLRSPVGASPK
jgi:hypothetical protein